MIATPADFRIGIAEIEKRRNAAERRLERLERSGAHAIEIRAARRDIERAAAALATLNDRLAGLLAAERGRPGRHRELAPHLPPSTPVIQVKRVTRSSRRG